MSNNKQATSDQPEITAETIKQQFEGKLPDITKSITDYLSKALDSGGINPNAYQGQGKYKMLNHILSAVFSQMADDYKPPHPTKDDIADIKNIKLFL